MYGHTERYGAIVEDTQACGARQLVLEARQQRLDAIDNLNRVGLRLPEDTEHNRTRALVPARGLVIFNRIDHDGQVAEPDRPITTHRDNDVTELLRRGQLGLRLNGQRL